LGSHNSASSSGLKPLFGFASGVIMPLSAWTNTQVIGQLNTGFLWQTPTITYAFPTVTDGLYSQYGEVNAFSALSAQQQVFATIAVGLWDDIVINDLVLTTSTSSNIEFANSYDGEFVDFASAYIPPNGTVWFNNAHDGSNSVPVNNADNNLVNPFIGGHGFSTYVHEVGHALGLDHAGDTVTPSNFRDSTVYSIMSYYGPSWGTQRGAPNDVAWADWVGSDNQLYEPQTPMIDDILAMQAMYGAETTTRVGDTVYGFNSTLTTVHAGIYDFVQNLNPIMCLYDAGGIDTLDLSGWNTVSNVNINAGAFSSANSMTNNISIAYAVVIENATTGGGNDVLIGNAGNNTLDGGGGADTLQGNTGNDTYYIDNAGDAIIEGVTDGARDVAYSTVSYGLAADARVEVLSTRIHASTAAINLTGNAFRQDIVGNAGSNVLNSGGGNDTLQGLGGDDVYVIDQLGDAVIEGAGAGYDTVTASISYTLAAGAEVELLKLNNTAATTALNLTGNAFINRLEGNAGNNTLDGGGGADTLQGNTGNDTYYIDNAGDAIIEGVADGARDVVYSTASYGLAADARVEVLSTRVHASTAAINLTGNAFTQDIVGNAGSNVLNGGGGNDTLQGLGGSDTFRFTDAAFGVDVITDFETAIDKLSFSLNVADAFSDFAILNNGTSVVTVTLASEVIHVASSSIFTLSESDFLFV
jgi:serralysin